MTNSTTLTLAFSAGMAAAVNPCGFALLPAYLSYYLGLETPVEGTGTEADTPASMTRTIPRAVLVGSAMTAGFVVVFGIVGLFWSSISSVVSSRLPWVTFAVGLLLVAGGIAMLFGMNLAVRLPKVQLQSSNHDLWSVFAFGISYAIASLSCTIPIFISLLSATFRQESYAAGVAAFAVYGLGMGAIIVVLTLAVASARLGVIHLLRRALPHMERVSAVFMIIAGGFVAYYGWWEAGVLRHPGRSGGLGARIQRWQDTISTWIQETGELRIGIGCAVIIGAAIAIALLRRRPDELAPESDDVLDSHA